MKGTKQIERMRKAKDRKRKRNCKRNIKLLDSRAMRARWNNAERRLAA